MIQLPNGLLYGTRHSIPTPHYAPWAESTFVFNRPPATPEEVIEWLEQLRKRRDLWEPSDACCDATKMCKYVHEVLRDVANAQGWQRPPAEPAPIFCEFDQTDNFLLEDFRRHVDKLLEWADAVKKEAGKIFASVPKEFMTADELERDVCHHLIARQIRRLAEQGRIERITIRPAGSNRDYHGFSIHDVSPSKPFTVGPPNKGSSTSASAASGARPRPG